MRHFMHFPCLCIVLIVGLGKIGKVHAIDENQFELQMQTVVEPFIAEHGEVRSFLGEKNIQIKFLTVWPEENAKTRGALVILPGRTESYVKYHEYAYDMMQHGFGPIYVIDHRGQGFSERLSDDFQEGHIDRYVFYKRDVETLVQEYVEYETKGPKFLIAHSLGGLIGGDFLVDNPNTFAAAVFYAPMFAINIGNRNPLQTEVSLALLCVIGKCKEYVEGQGDYNPDRVWDPNNDGTHSRLRWEYTETLIKSNPEIVLGGPTNGWITRSLYTSRMMQRKYDRVITPSILFHGGQDRTVLQTQSAKFCQEAMDCREIYYPQARHQIYHESDPIRQDVLQRTVDFLNSNAP